MNLYQLIMVWGGLVMFATFGAFLTIFAIPYMASIPVAKRLAKFLRLDPFKPPRLSSVVAYLFASSAGIAALGLRFTIIYWGRENAGASLSQFDRCASMTIVIVLSVAGAILIVKYLKDRFWRKREFVEQQYDVSR